MFEISSTLQICSVDDMIMIGYRSISDSIVWYRYVLSTTVVDLLNTILSICMVLNRRQSIGSDSMIDVLPILYCVSGTYMYIVNEIAL